MQDNINEDGDKNIFNVCIGDEGLLDEGKQDEKNVGDVTLFCEGFKIDEGRKQTEEDEGIGKQDVLVADVDGHYVKGVVVTITFRVV